VKRALAFAVVILALSVSAYAVTRAKQWRITAGDATNPQTISYRTTYGITATSWTAIAVDGGATLKFKGLGGRANWWLYLPAGASFTMAPEQYPVDSLTVLRDASSSGFYFVGVGGE
jgi:hypothetical protein